MDTTVITSAAKETNLSSYTLLMLCHSIPYLSESDYVSVLTIILKQSQDSTIFLEHKTPSSS